MSAVNQNTPPQNGTPAPPVDYVRSLPPEAKYDVFLALLKEVLAMSGGRGLVPFEDEDGRSLGYYVPPEAAKARAEALVAQMPPEVREKLSRPLPDLDLDDVLGDEEVQDIFNRGGSSPAR